MILSVWSTFLFYYLSYWRVDLLWLGGDLIHAISSYSYLLVRVGLVFMGGNFIIIVLKYI